MKNPSIYVWSDENKQCNLLSISLHLSVWFSSISYRLYYTHSQASFPQQVANNVSNQIFKNFFSLTIPLKSRLSPNSRKMSNLGHILTHGPILVSPEMYIHWLVRPGLCAHIRAWVVGHLYLNKSVQSHLREFLAIPDILEMYLFLHGQYKLGLSLNLLLMKRAWKDVVSISNYWRRLQPFSSVQFSSVQSLSRVQFFVTPWIAAQNFRKY